MIMTMKMMRVKIRQNVLHGYWKWGKYKWQKGFSKRKVNCNSIIEEKPSFKEKILGFTRIVHNYTKGEKIFDLMLLNAFLIKEESDTNHFSNRSLLKIYLLKLLLSRFQVSQVVFAIKMDVHLLIVQSKIDCTLSATTSESKSPLTLISKDPKLYMYQIQKSNYYCRYWRRKWANGYWNSECSKHMIRDQALLTCFNEKDGVMLLLETMPKEKFFVFEIFVIIHLPLLKMSS